MTFREATCSCRRDAALNNIVLTGLCVLLSLCVNFEKFHIIRSFQCDYVTGELVDAVWPPDGAVYLAKIVDIGKGIFTL
jgi:hypothetical protein